MLCNGNDDVRALRVLKLSIKCHGFIAIIFKTYHWILFIINYLSSDDDRLMLPDVPDSRQRDQTHLFLL